MKKLIIFYRFRRLCIKIKDDDRWRRARENTFIVCHKRLQYMISNEFKQLSLIILRNELPQK